MFSYCHLNGHISMLHIKNFTWVHIAKQQQRPAALTRISSTDTNFPHNSSVRHNALETHLPTSLSNCFRVYIDLFGLFFSKGFLGQKFFPFDFQRQQLWLIRNQPGQKLSDWINDVLEHKYKRQLRSNHMPVLFSVGIRICTLVITWVPALSSKGEKLNRTIFTLLKRKNILTS